MKSIYCLTILGNLFLIGCSALDKYERTYSASVDPDSKSGSISVTLRPVTPATPLPSSLNERVISELVAQALAKYEDQKVKDQLNK